MFLSLKEKPKKLKLGTPIGSQTAFGSPLLIAYRNTVFSAFLSLKNICEMNKNDLNTLKDILTSFWVCKHPKAVSGNSMFMILNYIFS